MWLKKLRISKNLTREQLASRLGVHFQTIQAWESGKTHVSDKYLKRFSVVFDKTEKELLRLKHPNLEIPSQKKEVVNTSLVSVLNEISETLKIIAQKL